LVFPMSHVAVAVLTNQDASHAAGLIGKNLGFLLLGVKPQGPVAAAAQAQELFENFQQGKIDRSLFTPWCNAYFDDQAIGDFQTSLAPLGKPADVQQTMEELRGGMTFRVFRVTFAGSGRTVNVTTYTMPDGKLEQYLVIPGS